MKGFTSSRKLFFLAFVIIIGVNLIILLGVLSNRNGTPDFEGFLTERELNLPWRMHNENSGMSLQVVWRTGGNNSYSGRGFPAWFDAKKLTELGFEVETLSNADDNRQYYNNQLPKEVYVVLEYNGAAYENCLEIVENELIETGKKILLNPDDKEQIRIFETAKENFEDEKVTKSKLFAIDVGGDHGLLRERDTDRSMYIITKGLVRPRVFFEEDSNQVVGYITKLSVNKIHIPLKFKKELEVLLNKKMTRSNENTPPRYKIELAYGKRLEPYIVSVKPSDSE